MTKEMYIWACCYSELTDASVSFGISIEDTSKPIEAMGIEWIWEGMSDSFWENCHEFEPYLEQIKARLRNNPSLSSSQALTDLFGTFLISYEVNGEQTELAFEIDVNDAMLSLLENLL